MKYRAYAILIAAVVVAGVLAFVLPGQNGQIAAMMAVTFAAATAFSAFVSWPAGRAFIERKPYLFKTLGGIAEALAVGVFALGFAVGMSQSASEDAFNPYITAAVTIMLIGMFLIMAPRTARQTREARAFQEAKASTETPVPVSSGGLREGVAALVRLAKDAKAFFNIVWPWLLLSCGPLLLAGWAWAVGFVDPRVQVIALGAGWLGFVVGLPTVLAAWHQWLIEGRKPGFTLPGAVAVAYGWRLWIYVAIANRVANWASEAAGRWALQQHLVQAFVPAALVNALSFALICALFGFQALRLPAIAVGDKQFTLALALTAARKMRFALMLGVLITFAPFFALRVVAEVLLFSLRQTVSEMEITIAIEFGLQFFAFAAGATLLSTAYMRSRAKLAALEAGL